jgi:hypothetical protein
MKKIILVLFILSSLTVKTFAQQFSQYNTGTLYDSFENPSQKAFITDTSRKYASNFFFPNANASFFLSGDGQQALRNRAFSPNTPYDGSSLLNTFGKSNLVSANANIYLIMFKMFGSFNGDTELGFSYQAKIEGNGLFTNGSIALLSGFGNNSGVYNNIFNDHYYLQAYKQMSFTYREQVNKDFSIGIKLSALFGIQYREIDVQNSYASYTNTLDQADIGLQGIYYDSKPTGNLTASSLLAPNFHNPGASITIGTTYKTEDNFIIQTNIKDLGFIHWGSQSNVYLFNNSATISNLSQKGGTDSLYHNINRIVHTNLYTGAFNTPIDGRAEVSVNKNYWIDDNHVFKYSPTLIASKELFYPGFIGALVNPIQYDKYVLTATTTYDDLKTFNVGLQAMIKTPNVEFYIGSDKLIPSTSLAASAILRHSTNSLQGTNTAADIFIGFSMKFGPVTEHPMNSSTMPMGEDEHGFFGRLWNKIFPDKHPGEI